MLLHKKYLPNLLSIIRIGITPIIIINFYLVSYFNDIIFVYQANGLLFLIASITDFLDGYIARNFDMESNSGSVLDPIADKILVTSILIMLVKLNKAHEIPCILIIVRELMVSGIRVSAANNKLNVPVSSLAKVKTFLQMTAIFSLLIGSKGSGINFVDKAGNLLLWSAAALSVITSIQYLTYILSSLNNSKQNF